MPEFLRQGDAADPLGVENVDTAICYGVHYLIPAENKMKALKSIYNSLKPGGLFWFEDPCYDKPFEQWHPDHKALMDINAQMHTAELWENMRAMVLEAGFEIVEEGETTQLWAESTWTLANDIWAPIIEAERDTYEPYENFWHDFRLKNKTKLYHDLRHLTLEHVRERFPRLLKYTDPEHYCFNLEPDMRIIKFILRKPAN
jgi:SAM-dependent methyltransferase